MIKTIKLIDFRCFEKTTVSFKSLSVIVGKNNAGKSTLIEALRILSLVVSKFKTTNQYIKAPEWVGSKEYLLGISPSLSSLEIANAGIIFLYQDGPAKIISEFENGTTITIFINYDLYVFATLTSNKGVVIESRKFALSLKLPEIAILPQISPLLREEPLIKLETVQKNISSHLSSRNFRNQLYYFGEEFDKFNTLAAETWPGLKIDTTRESIRTQGNLFLFVRDQRFEAEIGNMGHGLQMWLQTMWFLSRTNSNATVILDEPDVYMHADLQRRLIRLVKHRHKQVIIATHSVEIMAEVEPNNILPIDSTIYKQDYANKMPFVQKIIEEIGSVHNLEIARLFAHNKFLIVEGQKDDVKLLDIFQFKLFPKSLEQFETLPKVFVEGWGGWQRVIGSNMVFKENNLSVKTYCIFDSDYHTHDEIEKRYTVASDYKR